MKKKILILGSAGMAGHVTVKYFRERGYPVYEVNRAMCDVSNFTELDELIFPIAPDVVINCVGILKPNSKNMQQNAVMNVALPHFLAHLANRQGFKLIHLSTNCVFKDIGPHGEDEVPNADDLYGASKALGEVIDDHNLTIRTSITGPELKRGVNLFDWFVFQSGFEVTGFTNAMWNGVTTLELAKFMERAIDEDLKGIVNYYTTKTTDKWNLFNIINVVYELNKKVIAVDKPGVHSSLLKGPHFTTKGYTDMFIELRKWYK